MRQLFKRGAFVVALAVSATAVPLAHGAEAMAYRCTDNFSSTDSDVSVKVQACTQTRSDIVDGLATATFSNWSGVRIKRCYLEMTLYFVNDDNRWEKDVYSRNGCGKQATRFGTSRAARSSGGYSCGNRAWVKAYARVDYKGGGYVWVRANRKITFPC